MANAVWRGASRAFAFWLTVVGTCIAIERFWPTFNLELISAVIGEALAGELDRVSAPEFAYALAAAMAAVAGALALAFLLMHVVTIRLSLRSARRRVARAANMIDFADRYEAVYQAFCRHPLFGHAWKEFDETLVKPYYENEPIRNTVRPQTFVNVGLARDKLFGLKLMPSIPGYFVGLGLLLTFIGLVLALHKAAGAVNSTDAADMQEATRGLLQVATFKFATSIAGLGASIALSLIFRSYSIWIEAGFDRFCEAVERKLRYTAPQSITAEMSETLAAQLTELKQINSAEFFARMGDEISPQIQAAFATAMEPVTTSIDGAVKQLAANSESGMAELIARFSDSVQGSAGAELRELAASLKQMQQTLTATQQGIHGTGEDFGRRLTEAAEHLNRLVADAGRRMDETSEKTAAVLVDAVHALRDAFEQANSKVDEELGQAAAGASAKMEAAMGRVLERLESQVDGLRSGLESFQNTASRQLEETQQRVASVQSQTAQTIGAAASEAAGALQAGFADAMQAISAEIDRFTAALKTTESTLTMQAETLRDAASQSRSVADAFGKTAQEVRTASAPLVESGNRIADASDRMSRSVEQAVTALEAGQLSSKQLADALAEHGNRLVQMWSGFASRFENVDEDLASAVTSLAEAAQQQGQMLSDYAAKVDEGFAKAISHLNPFLEGLSESAEELNDAVERLTRTFPQAAE